MIVQRKIRPSFREHPLEAFLGLFADVRPGEGVTALLLTVNVFLLLTAYYLLKVAREPLILQGNGAEVKSYASVAQSLLLVVVTSAYGWLASRVGRMALITWITLIFVVNLVMFWALGERDVPLGIPFFLWVGIFNLMAVAQFWSFAADLYTEEQGKRLFPIVGIGSSVGAVAGATIADHLLFVGPFRLMLLAAGLLLVTLALYYVTGRRVDRPMNDAPGEAPPSSDQPLGREGGFGLVFRDPYLLLFAALIFVLNWVTKTGDYVLDRKLLDAAHAAGHVQKPEVIAFIGQFKARYFEWVNVLGVVFQLFFVSRIVKRFGMRPALLLMPIVSLAGYSGSFLVATLGALFVARTAESSLDYSLSNTTRQALWLVTSRDEKYKAKQVIDTFVVRAGDAASAGLVWLGVHFSLALGTFLSVNVALSCIWLVAAWLLGARYKDRVAEHAKIAPGTVSLEPT